MLWINTVILILTSFVFHKAKVLSEKNDFEKTKSTLLLVGFLSFAFITGQLLVWQHFISIGQYVSTNPANAFFYLHTALHGLHLLGGLYFWGRATSKFLDKKYKLLNIQNTITIG